MNGEIRGLEDFVFGVVWAVFTMLGLALLTTTANGESLCSGACCGPQCGAYILVNSNEQNGTLNMFAGNAGYLAYGTQGGGSIFEFVGNRLARKVLNNGKEEYSPDTTDSYGTHDISMSTNAGRLKLGGGSDTDTSHGGRFMLHGNTNVLAPGQVAISAGNTESVGTLGEESGSASLILETRAHRPLYLRTGDTTRIKIEGDGKVKMYSLPEWSPTLEVGTLYKCGCGICIR